MNNKDALNGLTGLFDGSLASQSLKLVMFYENDEEYKCEKGWEFAGVGGISNGAVYVVLKKTNVNMEQITDILGKV